MRNLLCTYSLWRGVEMIFSIFYWMLEAAGSSVCSVRGTDACQFHARNTRENIQFQFWDRGRSMGARVKFIRISVVVCVCESQTHKTHNWALVQSDKLLVLRKTRKQINKTKCLADFFRGQRFEYASETRFFSLVLSLDVDTLKIAFWLSASWWAEQAGSLASYTFVKMEK